MPGRNHHCFPGMSSVLGVLGMPGSRSSQLLQEQVLVMVVGPGRNTNALLSPHPHGLSQLMTSMMT